MQTQAIKSPYTELPLHGEIHFQGEQFFCDHEGAMFWPARDLLIVSDLHLEKGAAMAGRGFMAPPYDSDDTLNKLQNCIDRWNPASIISLGDSFHREDSADKLRTALQERLRQMTAIHDWWWITGNHDPQAPEHLGGSNAAEIAMGPICFRHEQDMLAVSGEISGHLHPAAKLHRRGKTLRRRCFASDGNRLIMPAFGTFTGGLDLTHSAFDGIFAKQNLQIWMLGRDRVYEISANSLITK